MRNNYSVFYRTVLNSDIRAPSVGSENKIFRDHFMEGNRASAGPRRMCKIWTGSGRQHGF